MASLREMWELSPSEWAAVWVIVKENPEAKRAVLIGAILLVAAVCGKLYEKRVQ